MLMIMKNTLLLLIFLPIVAFAQTHYDEAVRINQVGMYPKQEKVAVIEGGTVGQLFCVKNAKGNTVFEGHVKRVATSPWSGKKRAIADFSAVTTDGQYTFESDGHSVPFSISSHALDNIARSVLHVYYYQRSGMPIEKKYAGKWNRAGGHQDTAVYVHHSAVSRNRLENSVISSPGGWYNAGDYNKYIVSAAFTVGQLLSAYELNKAFFDKEKLAIPENHNSTPDILDEVMYELKWMLTMQDPADGGVYHKLTNAGFEKFIMPDKCSNPRYVVQKSVTATLDFAAVMAKAARIYKGNKDYPDFSEVAGAAAQKAWQWAKAHPMRFYNQNTVNRRSKIKISTGQYPDVNASDETLWAATELYFLTGDSVYHNALLKNYPETFVSPEWLDVSGLAVCDIAVNDSASGFIKSLARRQIIDYANSKMKNVAESNFQCPCGDDERDFLWGSLGSNFATPGMLFLYAYHLTGNKRYVTMAQEVADYILGRNAMGYCFVTGFGLKSPKNPHHRISFADGINEPVPGWLVGGPNMFHEDKALVKVDYPSDYPDESYVDTYMAFASNEVSINWNSSAVGLFSWLAAIEDK